MENFGVSKNVLGAEVLDMARGMTNTASPDRWVRRRRGEKLWSLGLESGDVIKAINIVLEACVASSCVRENYILASVRWNWVTFVLLVQKISASCVSFGESFVERSVCRVAKTRLASGKTKGDKVGEASYLMKLDPYIFLFFRSY